MYRTFFLKSLVESEMIYSCDVPLWLNVGLFSYVIGVIGCYHSNNKIYDFRNRSNKRSQIGPPNW